MQGLVDEKLPLKRLIPLGLQHVLAMYAGAVAVPLILGSAIGLSHEELAYLIAADLFTCGIATLLQTLGIASFIGIRLPIILGCSFVAVAPMILIAQKSGLPAVYGAIIASGLYIVLCSFFLGKILKLFPPIVCGSVISIVGLTLVPVAINNAAGGLNNPHYGDPKNLALAATVMITIILINKYFTGYIKALSVLLGIIVGTLLASFLGMTHFEELSRASYFGLIKPFYFGLPEFHFEAILSMCLVSTICLIETIGVFTGIGKICNKDLSENDLARGIRGEGVAQMLGGAFNSFPYTTFSQNVGLVALSGVRSRYVCACAGIILMILGLIPKFAAIATIIPMAVIGGAMIPMFGMVAAAGVKMLAHSVDFSKSSNLLIISCSLAFGVGSSVVHNAFDKLPHIFQLFLGHGIVSGSIVAIVLNLFLSSDSDNAAKDEELAL
ncbi:MAG: purine permease [Oligoflexia bacterium]|nr:purine permease [Oligoflexia bacterium]